MGYSRETTPRLQTIKDVVPFADLLTNAPHTSYSVGSMFSLRPITDWNSVVSERTIVSVFNEAGFETYWLSTQEADGWGGLIQAVAAESKHQRFFDRALDSVLVDGLRDILNNRTASRPLLVVLHTKGSHWPYDKRYPKDFAKYNGGASKREQLVDRYDNSILYTDWVISEVIRTIEQKNIDSAVLYLSDHGQNLLDDDRQLFGHDLGNPYDLHTSGLFWLSPSLKAKREREYLNLRNHSLQPISMADLSHSFLDIAGIRVDGFHASQSVFSSDYALRDRWYIFHNVANKERAEDIEK
jgi:heptose-I-phosphate ethanolaminephosphotransferase